jgi:hypothetical protein
MDAGFNSAVVLRDVPNPPLRTNLGIAHKLFAITPNPIRDRRKKKPAR